MHKQGPKRKGPMMRKIAHRSREGECRLSSPLPFWRRFTIDACGGSIDSSRPACPNEFLQQRSNKCWPPTVRHTLMSTSLAVNFSSDGFDSLKDPQRSLTLVTSARKSLSFEMSRQCDRARSECVRRRTTIRRIDNDRTQDRAK